MTAKIFAIFPGICITSEELSKMYLSEIFRVLKFHGRFYINPKTLNDILF